MDQPLSPSDVQRISPSALAYLGDAVYELYVRQSLIFPPQRIQAYHQQVVSWVRAESQAEKLDRLLIHLSEVELAIVKRGRNAAPQRLKRVDPEIYQKATALETLVGYLHLTDPDRLALLFREMAQPNVLETPESSEETSSESSVSLEISEP